MKLPKSTLTKNQKKTFRADYMVGDEPETLIAMVRHDDECGNGHNSFSITGTVYNRHGSRRDGKVKHTSGKTLYYASGGCVHETIAKHLPELAPYLKWHLTSTDGPMHYVANTVYHASDKDHWGLRKGEKRQIKNGGKTGLPAWTLTTEDGRDATVDGIPKHVDSHEQPKAPANGLIYSPWCHEGEGKERDLDAARRCAVWPDATDNDLLDDGLAERLTARLPALMVEFKKAVESLGLKY
jgi:hypothetical protein